MNIYFICTGNTCRSPMAEAILKSKRLPNVNVKSAGIYAVNGGAMSAQAQHVLQEENIAHDHMSKMLTAEDIDWADAILTMTEAHKQAIVQSFTNVSDKVYTLKEYVGEAGDVSDPYGGSVATYYSTFKQLKQLIDKLQLDEREV